MEQVSSLLASIWFLDFENGIACGIWNFDHKIMSFGSLEVWEFWSFEVSEFK